MDMSTRLNRQSRGLFGGICFLYIIGLCYVKVLADYTSTPDKITLVEERTNVTFSWTVSSSFTIVEVTFDISSAGKALLRVKPQNIVSVVSPMPVEYQGRVAFIGDLSTRKLDFLLTDVKQSDGNKYYGCTTFVSPAGDPSSFKQLKWSPTQLRVVVAPRFFTSPTVPDLVKEGDSLSIPCSTSEGNPTPVVSWMKGEVNISSGWGRADLNFTSIKKEDNGSYKCVAVNMKTTIQRTIQLDVKYKPETTILSSNATGSVAVTGEYILLTCNVPQGAANPQSIKYRFYHASTMLQDSSSGEYIIANVQLADKGQYKCVASNLAGDGLELFIDLIVHEPVKIISPSNFVVITRIKGEAVPLVCVATGYPSPKVTWTKDGKSIGINNNATIVKSTRYDAGTYKCTATNGVKEPKTVTITVRILYVPDIIVDKTNSTVGSWNGNTLTLQCVAKGEPPAGFQWYKPDGQQITSNIFPIKDGTTVTIKTTTAPGDYGKYKCRANNIAGFNEHIITVIQWVEPSEPEITDPDIQVSYIILRWTPPSNNGGSQVIDYKVTVKGDDQPRTLPPVTGTQTLITGLKPRWSYTFVLSARNVVGYGKSVSRTFKTKFKGKPGTSTIQNNETEISSKQITLTWSAAPENGAKILTYTLWWRQVDITGGVGAWSSRNTSSDALSFTVTWLEFGITYDFGVTAWNIYGEGPLDDENGLKRIKVVQELTEFPSTVSSHDKTSYNNTAVFGGLFGVMVVFNLIQLSYIIWLRRKMRAEKDKRSTRSFYEEKCTYENPHSFQVVELNDSASPNTTDYMPLVRVTKNWEILPDSIKIIKVIGKGAFGQVAKATLKTPRGLQENVIVAVKMLKNNAREPDKKDLLSELELMKRLKPHPHVIKLLGCVTKTDPLMVIIEYVPYGDLLGYLRKSRGLNDTYYKDPDIKPKSTFTSQQLIKFAWEVADGMAYLSTNKIIHRDLAARNVLVGEGETCKVTDFGMARDVQQEDIYTKTSKGRLPVKWTAYESLMYGKYTTQSDVWSFGVLLYEIFTIGGCPYPNMNGHKIAQILQDGYRMPRPDHLNQCLYKVMLDCWNENPDARPNFLSLRNTLRELEKNHTMYVNMKDYNSKLYANLEDLHGERGN